MTAELLRPAVGSNRRSGLRPWGRSVSNLPPLVIWALQIAALTLLFALFPSGCVSRLDQLRGGQTNGSITADSRSSETGAGQPWDGGIVSTGLRLLDTVPAFGQRGVSVHASLQLSFDRDVEASKGSVRLMVDGTSDVVFEVPLRDPAVTVAGNLVEIRWEQPMGYGTWWK